MKVELLSPAGTPEAFDAALLGGADAVYLGCPSFNARIHAGNFTQEQLVCAIQKAHLYGIKVYVTLNTLLLDREMDLFLQTAEWCYRSGADAAIIADLGASQVLRRYLPDWPLHASTQMSGHNAPMGKLLQSYGFSRMVVAREISFDSLREEVRNSPIETELFVHGALCVCHSGQCLFSSLVGGRSGNRGLCAQPCRLPYRSSRHLSDEETYPLSLKDLSLARHIPRILDMGVSSLKIEGRMKSPEYVYGVTSVFRRLLDEGRGATEQEMDYLTRLFSRDGFTDGYQTGKISSSMLGVRSQESKETTQKHELTLPSEIPKIPLSFECEIRTGRPMHLKAFAAGRTVIAEGIRAEAARTAPLTEDVVRRNLSKLGGTPFFLQSFSLQMDPSVMVPLAALNALRRDALARLLATGHPGFSLPGPYRYSGKETLSQSPVTDARFTSMDQISPMVVSSLDRLYFPLEELTSRPIPSFLPLEKTGVIMPPVIWDQDIPETKNLLDEVRRKGIPNILVGNLGHLSLAEAFPHRQGDFRLNAANRETRDVLLGMGLENVLLSPELTLPQIRDIGPNPWVIVYGRIPLMLLEKCVIQSVASCADCKENRVALVDRRQVSFPVLRAEKHRNILYNSAVTYMADQPDALKKAHVASRHFLFSVETAREAETILLAYRKGLPYPGTAPIRRIGANW